MCIRDRERKERELTVLLVVVSTPGTNTVNASSKERARFKWMKFWTDFICLASGCFLLQEIVKLQVHDQIMFKNQRLTYSTLAIGRILLLLQDRWWKWHNQCRILLGVQLSRLHQSPTKEAVEERYTYRKESFLGLASNPPATSTNTAKLVKWVLVHWTVVMLPVLVFCVVMS